MKRFRFIAGCCLSFALGTVVPVFHTQAQSSASPETYYEISFMKTKTGQDALKMERELWKPIQTDRVNTGQIKSWSTMQPIFSGPHPYDYMTVQTANSLDAFAHVDYRHLLTKVWGKEKVQSAMAQTDAARDMMGDEVWVVVDSVSK